jgi:TIR domain
LKRWDVFISHASEDKETVALPLAAALKRAGVRVWLDRFELRVGDSLREKIDEGLAESCFGIVVLSSDFLAKGWPKRELNGLFALEESGRKVILPVWHEITKSALAEHSPILADRLAAETSRGISSVAVQLLAAILDPNSGSPSVVAPRSKLRNSVYRRLVQ